MEICVNEEDVHPVFVLGVRSSQAKTRQICSWRRGRRRCARHRRRNTKSRCRSLAFSTPTRSQRRCVTELQIQQPGRFSEAEPSGAPTKTQKHLAWREALRRPYTLDQNHANMFDIVPVVLFTWSTFSKRLLWNIFADLLARVSLLLAPPLHDEDNHLGQH